MEYTYDAKGFKEIFESSFTWLGGFMRNVARFADKTALIDPALDKTWTYSDINKESNKLAHALKRAGVGRNDLVMYQLMNSAEFVFSYVAPRKIGAITSPANFNHASGETAKLIDHNKPKAFLYDTEVGDMVLEALSLCEHRPEIIIAVVSEKNTAPMPEGAVYYDDFVRDMPDTDPVKDFAENIYDETARLYTSGTTSLPKGVVVNNINEVLSAHDVMMHFPLDPTDITMNTTPWFHRGGIHSGGLTPTLYAGAAALILRNFSPRIALEFVERYGVTFVIGSPSVLEMLAGTQKKSHFDLSGLKGIVTMGAALEKSACIKYQQVLTPNIFNGYGTTETFWNTFLRPYDLPDMAGAAGRACTDDDVRVVKIYDDKRAEPDDLAADDGSEQGEIIIFSPSKSAFCYYDHEKLTKEKFYNGWLYTGDVGTWDSNKYVTVCGRKDDMIVCSGENIYPAQVEEALNEHPMVRECLVTSVPDSVRGQAVVAYVIPDSDSLTVAELIDFCNHSPLLSKYKRPRFYRFVDKLPYTATGKKQHVLMRAQALEDLEAGLLRRR